MKSILYKFIPTLAVIFFLVFSFSNPSFGQKTAYHDYGKLWINVVDNGNWDNEGWGGTGEMTWPNGSYRRDLIKTWWIFITAKEWKNAQGGSEFQAYWSPEKDFPGYAVGRSFTQYTRWAPPTIIVDGADMGMPFYGTVDNTLKQDVKIDWVWDTFLVLGFQGHQISYSWMNPSFDDFIIVDHSLKMTLDINGDGVPDCPDQTMEIAWNEGIAGDPCDWGHNQIGLTSWYSSMSWATYDILKSKYVTNKPRTDLYVSYAYDADDVSTTKYTGSTKKWDDTGDPRNGYGHFLSYQYVGYATLYADKSATEKVDDPVDKPNSVTYLSQGTDLWGHNWGMGYYDFMVQKQFLKEKYLYMGGLGNYNSRSISNFFQMETWGPYSMQKGQEVKTVYALGAGGIDEDLTFSKGAEWYNWMVKNTGTFDDKAKNDLIKTGKDSLFESIDRAYWVFNNGLNVSDPPPVPDIKVTSGTGKITVEWGYTNANMFKDADTGVDDFKEWRLYRKMGGPWIDDTGDAYSYYKYELIGTFPKGTTSYVDNTVVRGISYHYCVTAVDDGTQNKIGPTGFTGIPLESSYYKNRTKAAAVSVKSSALTTNDVVIVPNPYSISTGTSNKMNWPGEPYQISFLNLPEKCTLKIYTPTGDLVKTIEHKRGADEPWVDMRTASNQYPVCGVYLLLIDNARDSNNDPLPMKIYKFVIVR